MSVAGCVDVQRHLPIVAGVSLPIATSKSYASAHHTDRDKEIVERTSGRTPGKTRARRVSHRSPRKSPVQTSTGEVRGGQKDASQTQTASEPSWWSSDLNIGGWKIQPNTLFLISVMVALLVVISLSVSEAFDGTVVFFSSKLDLFLSFLPLIIMFLIYRVGEYETSESAWSIYTGLFWTAIGYNYLKALWDNRETPFLALCVGTGRITVGYLVPLIALFNFTGLFISKRPEQSAQEWQAQRLSNLAIVGACVWFLYKLIGRNPRRVQYAHAGGGFDRGSVHDDSFDDDGGPGDDGFSGYDEPVNCHQQQADPEPEPTKSFNPFDVLGVARGASQDQIKHAYREMSRMYHPDKTAHLGSDRQQLSDEKMKQINRAYEMLKAA